MRLTQNCTPLIPFYLLTYLLLFIKHYDTVQLNSTKYPQSNNQAVIVQVQYMHRLCALDSVIT